MPGIRRILTLVLVLLIVTATGIIAVNALETSEKSEVSASETEIVVFVRQDGLTQPYIYLWNSLPTNSAMSKSYPGEKMTKSGKWFRYSIKGVTKVNALRRRKAVFARVQADSASGRAWTVVVFKRQMD